MSAVFLLIGVVLLVKRPPKIGDVDPLGAVIGSMALVVGVWSAVLANRALRSGDTDKVARAADLAELVEKAEIKQRRQLIPDARMIDVGFVLVSNHEVGGAASAGMLTNVADYFRDLRPTQRLVITGAPGAGKTVLVINLILRMLEEREPNAPVPVRISAAAWDPGMDVEDLLVGHLMQTFGLREVTARKLVDARLVLPVIDGLDEMDRADEPGYDSAARRALEKLNLYQNNQGKASVILTCRTGQYQALTRGHAQARDAVHVDLVPVSPAQTSKFITETVGNGQVPRWQPILRALDQPGHPLAQTLTTPWQLTLAITVYQELSTTGDYVRDPADLAAYDDPADIHRHLLEKFIPASVANATRADRNPHRYRPDQVHTWLTVLARYLDTNTDRPAFAGRALSSTDIVLHELWPIARNRPRALTALLATLLTALPITAVLAAVATSEGRSATVWCGEILVLLPGAIAWRHPWPVPAYLDLSRLRTPSGRRRTLKWIAIGITAGPVAGLTFGLAGWFSNGFEDGLVYGITGGLVSSLVGAFVGGFTGGLTYELDPSDTSTTTNPRSLIHKDLTRWLIGGLTGGLVFGLGSGLVGGLTYGLKFGLADGLKFGLAGGLTFGLAGGLTGALTVGLTGGLTGALTYGLAGDLGYRLTVGLTVGLTSVLWVWAASGFTVRPAGLAAVRYLVTLVCMKRRLPLRLGRFLDWCYTDAGLVRTAGIAYQFRHRELQNHLAAPERQNSTT
ncbi:NACHT domain-containing protein [Spirillospora sp. NBC_01491]|uniref:NACHT domain-containing protein n=1 Tax=Spirillospora sp. NBC_01491 TaxID=2976007 RepID=UPI002E3224B4|nr:NACHT domain-containing protein [Spirillospora sp. NBC_01491]